VTKHSQSYIIENCISKGQVINENRITNNRKFNFTDFYYILCRSMKSSLIREWRSQFLRAFCLFFGVILCLVVYPNDIGSDPLCSIDLLNDFNLTQITDQVYDAINGKRSDGEMNVSYLIILFLVFGLIYIQMITFVFPDEIKVRIH